MVIQLVSVIAEQKISDKNVQDLTDKYIKEIDGITAAKEKEIMEI